MATTDYDDHVSSGCHRSLSILTSKYWEALDNPAGRNDEGVRKKQVHDAMIESAKARPKRLTLESETSQTQAAQAGKMLEQMQAVQHATDAIMAPRFIAFVAAV